MEGSTEQVATLQECISTFQEWLHMPDPGILEVTLGTVVANRLDGDPVWLLIVGPPGGGKTETLGPILDAPGCHSVATLTEASLLSGTPKREVSDGSTGGLLKSIGEAGIIVSKDFGSVLSMHRDARAAVFAALREIYDGSWTRHVGTDGGRALRWRGKVGLIAACTPAIDRHHGVIGSMGERFVMYRVPPTDADAQARKALRRPADVTHMRAELARAATRVLDHAGAAIQRSDDGPDERGLVSLSTLAATCRSSVEREGTSREVESVSEPEAPARLALVLRQLWLGLRAVGTPRSRADRLVVKVALDSMPAPRRRALDVLTAAAAPVTVLDVARALRVSKSAARRVLEDLEIVGVAASGDGGSGSSHDWALSEWTRERWAAVSEVYGDGFGTGAHSVENPGGGPGGEMLPRDHPDTSETLVEDGLVPYPLSNADDVLATDAVEDGTFS